MRTIKQTAQFKRDLKREAKGKYGTSLETILLPVITNLVADKPLAPNFRDHLLAGNKRNFRACHLKPDLVLLYQLPDDETLTLVRPGSHARLNL